MESWLTQGHHGEVHSVGARLSIHCSTAYGGKLEPDKTQNKSRGGPGIHAEEAGEVRSDLPT